MSTETPVPAQSPQSDEAPLPTDAPETTEDPRAFARSLAKQLGEIDPIPLKQLRLMALRCGVAFCQKILEQTLEVQAQGGMMVKTGERPRTIGGVFFFLARNQMGPNDRRIIFSWVQNPQPKPGQPSEKFARKPAPQPKEPAPPAFVWDERLDVLNPLLAAEKGVLTTVKVVLIGRPGKVEVRQDLAIVAMEYVARSPTLPKGVPAPPTTPTLYTVYIGAKQWRRVQETITIPEDALIIEGTAAFDPAIKGIAVFATNVTTKVLEAQKREAQKAKADPAQTGAAPDAAADPQPPPQPAARPPAPATRPPAPAGMPPEAAQKLSELQAAASLYRQKIAGLMAKPPDQRMGLEMTQKLLKNTEQEIANIEQRFAR